MGRQGLAGAACNEQHEEKEVSISQVASLLLVE